MTNVWTVAVRYLNPIPPQESRLTTAVEARGCIVVAGALQREHGGVMDDASIMAAARPWSPKHRPSHSRAGWTSGSARPAHGLDVPWEGGRIRAVTCLRGASGHALLPEAAAADTCSGSSAVRME